MNRCKIILEKLGSRDLKDLLSDIESPLNKWDGMEGRFQGYLNDMDKVEKLESFLSDLRDKNIVEIEKFIKKL